VLADCPQTSTACTGHQCINVCGDGLNGHAAVCQFGCCTATNNGVCKNGMGDTTCGKSGVCVDCSMQAAGHVCLPGTQTCGCTAAANCPPNEACDTGVHACTTACSGNQPCNGGCCNKGTCAVGTAPTACGGMNACVDCTNNVAGHACVAGICGCNSATDCGAQRACDVAKHMCTNACNANQLCNGGCCLGAVNGMNGTCDIGTGNSSCGSTGGACAACANDKPTCIAGACNAKCGGTHGNNLADGKCDGGNCCNIVNAVGACVAGTANTTCGFSGTCANCTNNSNGSLCETPKTNLWHCGCDSQTNCFAASGNTPGQSCDLTVHTCTNACGIANVTTACNGGCCGPVNGTNQCRPGNQDAACGSNGGLCNSCATCQPGPHCDALTGACGCDNLFQCYNNGYFNGTCGPRTTGRLGCTSNTMGTFGACCAIGGTMVANAATCCTGQAMAGVCTCIANGMPATNGNPSSCCSVFADANAMCAGRPACHPTAPSNCTTANTCFQNSDCADNNCHGIGGGNSVCCDPMGATCTAMNNTCCSGVCGGNGRCM
jgi:hypothetical protein